MVDDHATSGVEFSNSSIIIWGSEYTGNISFISIEEVCPYSLMGITVGMSFTKAMEVLEQQSISADLDHPTYKHYVLSDDYSISIWSDDGKMVSSVSLFGDL